MRMTCFIADQRVACACLLRLLRTGQPQSNRPQIQSLTASSYPVACARHPVTLLTAHDRGLPRGRDCMHVPADSATQPAVGGGTTLGQLDSFEHFARAPKRQKVWSSAVQASRVEQCG